MDDIDVFLANGGDEGSGSSQAYFDNSTLVSSSGDNNSLPLLSDVTTPTSTSNSWLQQFGSALTNLPKTAAQLGTVVGTAKADIAAAKSNYNLAQSSAASNNALGVWWANASMTDKLMVGLAVVGIAVVVLPKMKL